MEKIIKPKLASISSLSKLAENFEIWGIEYKTKIDNKKKGTNVIFTWRDNLLYREIRTQLASITNYHCSFCDSYPVAKTSKETIEHYYPKAEYPLQAYDWDNLFYSCDKCQEESNKISFVKTLKPDEFDYFFDKYFYFDLSSGEIKVLEHLKVQSPTDYNNAKLFLERYGINSPTRNQSRQRLYEDVRNYLIAMNNNYSIFERERNDFEFRFVYDFCVDLFENKFPKRNK
jgi:uncharacterized protein (TIGR02646 family)